MYRKVQESAVSKNTVSRCLAVRRHRVGPNQEARPVEQSPRWSRRLLLGGSRFGGGVGILFSEALNAARSVKQFLLAGEEGMAIRADFHAQHFALDGRARLKRVAAGAVHRNGMIIGMNSGFHGAAFRRVRSARHTRQGREFEAVTKDGHTAASLGREQFSIIREESNSAKSVG